MTAACLYYKTPYLTKIMELVTHPWGTPSPLQAFSNAGDVCVCVCGEDLTKMMELVAHPWGTLEGTPLTPQAFGRGWEVGFRL